MIFVRTQCHKQQLIGRACYCESGNSVERVGRGDCGSRHWSEKCKRKLGELLDTSVEGEREEWRVEEAMELVLTQIRVFWITVNYCYVMLC